MCQLGKNLYSIDIIKLIALESCWLLALALLLWLLADWRWLGTTRQVGRVSLLRAKSLHCQRQVGEFHLLS
ncbi:hypothetical protein EB796_024757 [Bugula neritina]|uniref:Uncharacterized protein n=1 Tax=Bugula neritina TaxID=10212 RepID=A0A7J7IUP1_BUGNE|nr:hypothetical protein EB796_024757 [Bugula neritina]